MRALLKTIDRVLDAVTMYRLTLYVLCIYVVVSIVAAWFGFVPYTATSIVVSTIIALVLCLSLNWAIAILVGAATSVESAYITALILVLIIPPPTLTEPKTFLAIGGA